MKTALSPLLFAAAVAWFASGAYALGAVYLVLAYLWAGAPLGLPNFNKPKELSREEKFEQWLWDPNTEIKLPELTAADRDWMGRNLKDLQGTELTLAQAARRLYAEDKINEPQFERLMERALNAEAKITEEEFDGLLKDVPALSSLPEHPEFKVPARRSDNWSPKPPGTSTHLVPFSQASKPTTQDRELARAILEQRRKKQRCQNCLSTNNPETLKQFGLCGRCLVKRKDAEDQARLDDFRRKLNGIYASPPPMYMGSENTPYPPVPKATPSHECRWTVGSDYCIHCGKLFGGPDDRYYIART